MRNLIVLLAILALAVPASAQLFVGTGSYNYDDDSDGISTDNSIRIGRAGAIGAGTYVSGTATLMTSTNNFELGTGTIDAVNLVIKRGWGSLVMVDGNLDITRVGSNAAYYLGRSNGTAYLTQVGGTLAIGQGGREVMIGAPSTSGGFPKQTEGLGEAYIELKGGMLTLRGSPKIGAYNYYKDADPLGASAIDATGMCKGVVTQTGGSFIYDPVTQATQQFHICYTGGDGTLNLLGGVARLNGYVYMGTSDQRTYVGGSTTYTVDRDGSAVLKIGKDADVSMYNFAMFDNDNKSELQIEIASLTDFSSFAVTQNLSIGSEYSAGNPGKDPTLAIDLQGYNPQPGDEWILATTGGSVSQADFSAITADAPLDDPNWYFDTRVDGGNQLVLFLVPEPATMALLALGGLALIRRRR